MPGKSVGSGAGWLEGKPTSAGKVKSATRTSDVNIVNNIVDDPKPIWGKSAKDISNDLNNSGYNVNIRQSNKGSAKATIIDIESHPKISQIEVHPGGGRHQGAYYRISTTTQGKIKVVDPATYKATPDEKATIISGVN